MSYRLQTVRGWPRGLEYELARIDADVAPDWYRQEFECGRLELLAIMKSRPPAELPACYVLTRRDGLEQVIVAAVSLAPELALTLPCLPLIEERARGEGCRSVRFHTRRWGLAALAGEAGYQLADLVLRKAL